MQRRPYVVFILLQKMFSILLVTHIVQSFAVKEQYLPIADVQFSTTLCERLKQCLPMGTDRIVHTFVKD